MNGRQCYSSCGYIYNVCRDRALVYETEKEKGKFMDVRMSINVIMNNQFLFHNFLY